MTGFLIFLARRLLALVVVVWAATLGAFVLFRIGVPNPGLDARIGFELGPDQPVWVQYLHWVGRLLHGNLGESLVTPLSVDSILRDGLAPTLSLMTGGLVLWLAIGLIVGTYSALHPRSWTDRLANAGVLAGLTVPTFLTALLLLDVGATLAEHQFHWMGPGYVPITQNPGLWLGRMILPWVTVALSQAAITARLVRSGILDALGEDYIRTARAKGVSERRIMWLHVSRSAIIPVLSSIGPSFSALLASAAIVDEVFGLGGIGQAFLIAARAGDLMTVLGAVLIGVVLVAVINLLTDIGYALLYPQVRLT
jgi:peptide/nickel transport system permease protein